jgi:hypothetical protein
MSIQVGEPQLDSTRAANDAPVAAVHGQDMMKRENDAYERITDSPAPGATAITSRGHVHDGDGDGRGIMRAVDGGFLVTGLPLVYSTDSTTAISLANGDSGNYETSGTDFVMGVAYVSPGLVSIKFEVCIKADDTAGSPEFRVYNITDTISTAWEAITTTDPKWYTITLNTITDSKPNQTRIELDVQVRTDGTTRQFSLLAIFPFEYTDQA